MEQFFLSIVAKTGSNSIFADTWYMLRKFYTAIKKEEMKVGLGVGEVLRKDLTRQKAFI